MNFIYPRYTDEFEIRLQHKQTKVKKSTDNSFDTLLALISITKLSLDIFDTVSGNIALITATLKAHYAIFSCFFEVRVIILFQRRTAKKWNLDFKYMLRLKDNVSQCTSFLICIDKSERTP